MKQYFLLLNLTVGTTPGFKQQNNFKLKQDDGMRINVYSQTSSILKENRKKTKSSFITRVYIFASFCLFKDLIFPLGLGYNTSCLF